MKRMKYGSLQKTWKGFSKYEITLQLAGRHVRRKYRQYMELWTITFSRIFIKSISTRIGKGSLKGMPKDIQTTYELIKKKQTPLQH